MRVATGSSSCSNNVSMFQQFSDRVTYVEDGNVVHKLVFSEIGPTKWSVQ